MPLKCVNSHKTEFVLASGQTDNFQKTLNFSSKIQNILHKILLSLSYSKPDLISFCTQKYMFIKLTQVLSEDRLH